MKKNILNSSVRQMLDLMKSNNKSRLMLKFGGRNSAEVNCAISNDLSEAVESVLKRDFNNHEAIFIQASEQYDALFSASVCQTVRGQAAGGVRYCEYENISAFIDDGLRLSNGMGRKNALAGLWWGGGKGGITRLPGQSDRAKLYQQYGNFISSLRGVYVTAEDAGTRPEDMDVIYQSTRFTTCINPLYGGSGNPSTATGKGVVCAMEAALHWKTPGDTIAGKTIAIQGAGHVSTAIVKNLLSLEAKRIKVSDICSSALKTLKASVNNDPRVEFNLVVPNDHSILFENVDIVSPSALGGSLNSETIPKIKAPIIVGAANNQLLDEQTDSKLITEKGIVYVPDFLCNRMGIVNCSNEQYGNVVNDPLISRHFGREWENSIFKMTINVLNRSKEKNVTSAIAANEIADELSLIPHPIFGHRGKQIVNGLLLEKWHLQL